MANENRTKVVWDTGLMLPGVEGQSYDLHVEAITDRVVIDILDKNGVVVQSWGVPVKEFTDKVWGA